jgi:hypothetical protein
MASNIDATKPADGVAAEKAELRTNLAAAKAEIEAIQAQIAALQAFADGDDFFLYNPLADAANDRIYDVHFRGQNSAATAKDYARVRTEIASATPGAETARFMVLLQVTEGGGVEKEIFKLGPGTDLTLTSSRTGSTSSPRLILLRNNAAPADDDSGPEMILRGLNDAGQEVDWISLLSVTSDVSDGTEDGSLLIRRMNNGAPSTAVTIGPLGMVLTSGMQIGGTFDANSQPITNYTQPPVEGVSGLLQQSSHGGRLIMIAGNITVPVANGFTCHIKNKSVTTRSISPESGDLIHEGERKSSINLPTLRSVAVESDGTDVWVYGALE